MALDGFNCALREIEAPELANALASQPLNLAGQHARALLRWLPKGDIAFVRSEKSLLLRAMDDGEYLSLPLNYMAYPDYTVILAKKQGPTLTLSRVELCAALDRVCLIAPERSGYSFTLRVQGDEALFRLEGEGGNADEALRLEGPVPESCPKALLPAKRLREVLGYFPPLFVSLTLTGERSPIFVHAGDFPGYTALVMPPSDTLRRYGMNDFIPIPGHPDYSINPQGRVRSERSGLLLSHDGQGRVRLREGRKRPAFFVGELLALAGLTEKKKAAVLRASPPKRESSGEAKTLAASLDKARRVNGHLLALVEKLRGQLADQGTAASASRQRKRGRKVPLSWESEDMAPLNFEDASEDFSRGL